ncbi:hypothetical protein [Sphingomonas montanisoli]|uniref:Hemerythrin domain-containing protein n=1 Tax=Sphingomonas montanisoli TaxID=2606412 RepID=A0A5D9C713_9SPHN|nr:hypothetical protein [Sphingomonas montanisoli]TZG27584.1 hypothetical protein FYJ91_08340 [Sphingomonas montanisoli]
MNALAAERARLLAAIDQIEALVAGGYVEQGPAQTEKRWAFTREMLLHLSHLDAQVFLPLMADERPLAAKRAAEARAAAIAFYEDFRAHAERWRGRPTEDRWPSYRHAVRDLMQRLRVLLREDARRLKPFLPPRVAAGAARSESRNFAAVAWDIHKILNS